MRIEQLKAEREVMHGHGNARNLAPGYLFNLSKYPRSDQNQQYLIEAADYRFEENVYRSDGGGGSGAAKRGGMDSPTTYRLAVEVVLLGAASLGAWAILLAMVVAVPVYGISLTMLGGATKEDLQNLPFIGRRVLALGQRFGYFKN